MHLKEHLKKDEHFVLLNDLTWQFLYQRYGGTDLPRLSIADETSVDNIFDVEVNISRLSVMTYPKIRYISGIN